MVYQLEQGRNEDKIIELARKTNMPVPEKIRNKPTIKLGLEIYWSAFSDLSSDREIGMGVGPIPWTAINQWGLRHDIEGDDFERLVLVVRGVDAVYTERQNAKSKSSKGKGRGGFSKPKAIGG